MSLLKEIKEIPSTKKDLRSFAYVVGGVLLALGGLRCWHHKSHYSVFLIVGGVLVITGTWVPIVLKPLQKIWMALAVLLGWVMTRVILTVLFFLIATPLSLAARLSGKKFLDLRFREAAAPTYWIPKTIQRASKKDFEKQF